MRNTIHTKFGIKLIIFVTGSSAGFPTMYDLSARLVEDTSSSDHGNYDGQSGTTADIEIAQKYCDGSGLNVNTETTALLHRKKNKKEYHSRNNSNNSTNRKVDNFIMEEEEEERPISAYPHNPRRSRSSSFNEIPTNIFPDGIVCESLDRALIIAEDALIALVNPDLIVDDQSSLLPLSSNDNNNTKQEEKDIAFNLFKSQCHGEDITNASKLFDYFEREVWMKDEIIWKENDTSNCMKMIVYGKLISIIDNDPDASEGVHVGAIFGELGLVSKSDRLTTIKCVVDNTILYSLNKEKWDMLLQDDPKLARLIDLIAVRYLAHRVQHVSNRIFETRCLPI